MKAACSILAALLLLCSCVQVPERSSAPLSLPETFSSGGTAELQNKWWQAFGDRELGRLIEKALSDNFSLRGTRERIIQAEAVATQAGASLYPSLDIQGSGSTTRNYQTDSNSNVVSLGLGASYELDLWGRLRSIKDGALLDLAATTADYETARITLSAEIALSWFEIIESKLQEELLQQQKATNEKVLEVITTQFRSGKTDIADVLQQRQLVESNNGSLASLRASTRVLENKLAILIGEIPERRSAFPERAMHTLPELPPLPQTGLPLDLVTRRPDVKSSFLSLQAADQRAAAAVANRFPRLSLSGSLTTSGDSASDLFSDWFSTLAANLVGPLIDGGYLRAEVKRTQSLTRQLLSSYSQTILEAVGEVENCLVREEEQLNYLSSEKRQLQLATETIAHVANRYRQGAEDYQRVLTARISQQNLQRSLLSTSLSLLSNRITLYRALSGSIE